jgi:ATP-dependent DNA helicase RecG
MNRKTLTGADVSTLVKRDEDHFFDRKSLMASGRTIQKIGVAFANSDGGEFVIGVADEKEEPKPDKRWNGAAKIEDFNGHIQALSEITPSLPYEISVNTATSTPTLNHTRQYTENAASVISQTAKP